MAARGRDVLRLGPMMPVRSTDPGRKPGDDQPYAVVQLRQEDRAGQMWNLVGFQTRLNVPEQQRVFRMIPGLEHAEFLRFGSIHRNAYINSPRALTAHLSAKDDPRLLFAGQLTGVALNTGELYSVHQRGDVRAALLRRYRAVLQPGHKAHGHHVRQRP